MSDIRVKPGDIATFKHGSGSLFYVVELSQAGNPSKVVELDSSVVYDYYANGVVGDGWLGWKVIGPASKLEKAIYGL